MEVEGGVLFLLWILLLLGLFVGHATGHFVASVSPTIGRAGHTAVRFLSFPIPATEVELGCCGQDKRRKDS